MITSAYKDYIVSPLVTTINSKDIARDFKLFGSLHACGLLIMMVVWEFKPRRKTADGSIAFTQKTFPLGGAFLLACLETWNKIRVCITSYAAAEWHQQSHYRWKQATNRYNLGTCSLCWGPFLCFDVSRIIINSVRHIDIAPRVVLKFRQNNIKYFNLFTSNSVLHALFT